MIIVPDIHGRDFWKSISSQHTDEEIVFLGDYTDPYFDEDTRKEDVPGIIQEIIEIKKANPDTVTLLLGNHDCSYLSSEMPRCRFDFKRQEEIRSLFRDNLDLFDIATVREINGTKYIFSHAGIHPSWLELNKTFFSGISKPSEAVPYLNRTLHNPDEEHLLWRVLSYVGSSRGGWESIGSCVWVDIFDWFGYESYVPEDKTEFQVFGHTKLLGEEPLVHDWVADLDCKCLIRLTPEGKFIRDQK